MIEVEMATEDSPLDGQTGTDKTSNTDAGNVSMERMDEF
jgi:hypothetical protein